MNDDITLADPAISCETAALSARRIEALTLVLAAALESPRKDEVHQAMPEFIAVVHAAVSSMRLRTEEAAEAIRRAEA